MRGTIHFGVKTVTARDVPDKCMPVGFQPDKPVYACIEVKDSGCGIQQRHLGIIFDPFFSTKFTGRGLGLSVALGIIREHNGAVAVGSVSGKGSVFRIYLPILNAPERTGA